MLAVVKKPRTNTTLFELKGDIPYNVVEYLEQEFGQNFEVVGNDDEELVNIFETEWYKEVRATTTPGDTLKIYRENLGLTQAELGEKLGNLTERTISDMESGTYNIPQDIVEKLSQLFDVPANRFL